jgi:hypothetical protein
MQTVKGRAVGEESVIGELVRYRNCGDYFDRRARIALIDADTYDFDMLFEVSQEFMGFVWVGEFDKGIAEMAEELRLVGLFCDDEKRLCDSVNEMMIILPKKNRAILAPDIRELTDFESTLVSCGGALKKRSSGFYRFSRKYKKDLNKIKKYF